MASGAPRPPWYATWDSSSPAVAIAATASSRPTVGTTGPDPPTSRETSWVRAEATAKAIPAPVATSRLRGTAERAARPASTSPTTDAVATAVSSHPWSVRSWCVPAPGMVTASRATNPAMVTPAPSHCRAEARRPIAAAPIGSARTRVSTPSGCTTESGPYASAATCRAAPARFSATEPHQRSRPRTAVR